MFCPVCQNNYKHSKLVPKQINFSTAVYLCEDEKCTYPVGYDCTFIQRNLDDIHTWKEPVEATCVINPSKHDDIDIWLNEIFDSTPCGSVLLNSSDNNTFDLAEFETFLNLPSKNEENSEVNNCYNDQKKKEIDLSANKAELPVVGNQKQTSNKICYTSYIIKPAADM